MQLRWLERKPGEWVLQTRHVESNGVIGPGSVVTDSGWQDVPKVPHDAGEPRETRSKDSKDIIADRVIATISEQLGVADRDIDRDMLLHDDLGADSLDIAELEMALNEDFDIELLDDETEQMETVRDAIRFVKRAIAREIQE